MIGDPAAIVCILALIISAEILRADVCVRTRDHLCVRDVCPTHFLISIIGFMIRISGRPSCLFHGRPGRIFRTHIRYAFSQTQVSLRSEAKSVSSFLTAFELTADNMIRSIPSFNVMATFPALKYPVRHKSVPALCCSSSVQNVAEYPGVRQKV